MKQADIVLDTQLRGGHGAVYLPEEAVELDLRLRNVSAAAQDCLSLSLNSTSPVLSLYDEKGGLLAHLTPQDRSRRQHHGAHDEANDQYRIQIPPGKEEHTWLSLWEYTSPFAPGRYSVEVVHRATTDGEARSLRIPFEIVRATAGAHALGYDSPLRGSSIFAWMATPDQGEPRLLLRMSGASNHHSAFQGAFGLGGIGGNARLAVGQSALGTSPNGMGWVAALDVGEIELIRHNMASFAWRSGKVPIPILDPIVLQRFPDRGHAVALLAGKSPSGAPVLFGVRAEAEVGVTTWSVPLSNAPAQMAASFSAVGPIRLLLAGDDGAQTTYSRLDVDEAGQVISKEHVIGTSPTAARAMDVDFWNGDNARIFVLEVDRANPAKMAVSRIDPRTDRGERTPLQEIGGYPTDSSGPSPAVAHTIEIDPMDEVWISVLDVHKRAFAGRFRAGLAKLGAPAAGLHVAALLDAQAACFTPDGYLSYGGH